MNVENLTKNFSKKNLISFFKSSITSFKYEEEEIVDLFNEDIRIKYETIKKIGEAKIENDDLMIIASKTNEALTERSGKKNQYEIAKKILKDEVKDAAIFVFYDDEGNFRFSFVKANYLGTKRDFTDFKRYTYYVTPQQTNKTFIKQIGGCNFNSLDEIIRAFSVEPLNKQFYQDIANIFYKLIGGKVKIGNKTKDYQPNLSLPSILINENRKIYQEFAVRLIGRTIFCWFLKNKKSNESNPLVPDSWLSSDRVKRTNEKNDNYYHAILEKLFFLVLNKKLEERKDYELPEGHEQIPFLNGGLFEAQEDDFFPKNNSDKHQINFSLKIPNDWFVKFFETLEQYNFTIDENSIYDAEVSIDPEMLGTIFENLLAEIDPDTEKSARKATGSFYTPREIVDYMVEQSLVQYLITKVATENEEQLLELFKEGGENKFEPNETKKILEALSEVKILDPACGSGAFPMGALHKIIIALQKLDPDASWWKEKQIANVPNALAKKMLKEKLDGESADYVRKLGVIQNSIYGVDIQPVAIEISKLRSFLSLVIDETIDDKANNRGIQALPNLEFKFVTANSLIGLEDESSAKLNFGDISGLRSQLEKIREQYLQAYGDDKKELKQEFECVQKKIIGVNASDKRAIQLASWNPFSNESNAWFDPYWMYGVDKFDIVIGNPPYGFRTVLNKKEKVFFRKEKSIVFSSGDSAELFSKISFDRFVKENSILSFIIPKKSLYGDAWEDMRINYWYKNQLCFIMDTGKSFANVLLEASVFGLKKSNSNQKIKLSFYDKEKEITDLGYYYKDDIYTNANTIQIYKTQFPQTIIKKIEKHSYKETVIEGDLGLAIGTDFFSDYKEEYKLLKGIDIQRYQVRSHRYLKNKDKINWDKAKRFLKTKVICQRLIAHIENPYPHLKITACYDSEGILITNTLMSFKIVNTSFSEFCILGYLNSKILSWYAYNFVYSKAIRGMDFYNFYIQQVPIPNIEKRYSNKVEELVKQRLNGNENKESEIDIVFFKAYEFDYQEVKIIDPAFPLTQEEYENYKIE